MPNPNRRLLRLANPLRHARGNGGLRIKVRRGSEPEKRVPTLATLPFAHRNLCVSLQWVRHDGPTPPIPTGDVLRVPLRNSVAMQAPPPKPRAARRSTSLQFAGAFGKPSPTIRRPGFARLPRRSG